MITRRRLLGLLPAIALGLRAEAQDFLATPKFFHRREKKQAPPPQPWVYIGSDTAAGPGKGIYACRFDTVTGQLTQPILAATTFRPAFFALGPLRNGRRFLYVTNEGKDETATVTTFAVDAATGALSSVGKVPSGFAGACYISVDVTGSAAYVANFYGSGISSYRIQPDGTLSGPVEHIDFHAAAFGQQGPVTARQDAPHPHSTTISPDNRFLIVNDLGNDQIVTFALEPDARLGEPHLSGNHRPGSGPRHVAFHPNGRWVYGITEIDSSIDQYLWIATHGHAPEALLTYTDHTVRTVEPDYHGPTNTAAEIAISANGYFLYASNRGEDSLVVFAIDPESGALTLKQRIPCGGHIPRHFTLDPTGRWLLCGNQNSSSVTVFARNEGTGLLTGPVQTLAVESPMFTLFA